jgi:hypothetical protein
MTISKEEQKRALEQAFKCIAEIVGDGDFLNYEFDDDTPGLKTLPKTTLKELEDYHILKRTNLIAVMSYNLTASGWIEVLSRTGQLRSPENLRRAGILAGVLKSYVKDREDEEIVTDEVISKVVSLGVPEGWIWSALECSLLDVLWPGRQMDVYFTSETQSYLHVSARFGMDDEGVMY